MIRRLAIKKCYQPTDDGMGEAPYVAMTMGAINPDKVREAVRAFMAQRNLSIPDWTRAAGKADATLRNFLGGHTNFPGLDTWMALAEAAGATVSEIIGEPARSIPHATRVDAALLGAILEEIDLWQKKNAAELDTQKKASVAAVLYDLAEDNAGGPFRLSGRFENVVRLVVGHPK